MSKLFGKSEYIIEMCKEQYDEMYEFYISLGYSEKQAKKLSSSCFKAEIVVTENSPYRNDWCFYRKRRPAPVELNFKNAARRKSAPVESGAFLGSTVLMDSCMMGAGMPAPMPGQPEMMRMAMPMMSAPMVSAEPPEFNTAETKAVSEIEETGTLDRPQMIFSANVNTASWSYLRDKIIQREQIDKSFVRIEEIINSYKYKMKSPKDDELFSLRFEHGSCPWNEESELLMVGLKGRKSPKKVKQNLAFLVDVSGSMTDNWVLTQMSLAAIVSKMKKGDFMSIIAYSDETVTVVKKMDSGDMGECVKAILSIDGIGGCTNGSDGLENAYKYLSDNYEKDGNNRVFIFTDGDFNFGITGESGLTDFIYKKRETGIYLSIVGYGRENFKDNKMEALARNGNGNYTFIADPADIMDNLWEKLVSNLVTVAKDVKISVELNPYYVNKYRLIGYDARVLTKQEFNDTEKAVDGIGSGHNVAALIEFSRGKAERTSSSRYVTTESQENKDEFAFIEIHYKTPEDENCVMTKVITAKDLENAKNKNMPVITLLAAFGLVVKDSRYKGSADMDMLRNMIKELEDNEHIDKKSRYSHFNIIKKYCDS